MIGIVGEALHQAEMLDSDVADSIPDIRDIVGTRNRFIHGYGDVNLNLVWDMVEVYIPAIIGTLDTLLDDWPPRQDP